MLSVLRIFVSPISALRSPNSNAWRAPFTAVILVSILITAVEVHIVGLGDIVRSQMKSSPQVARRLGDPKMEAIAARAESSLMVIVSYAVAPIAMAIIVLVSAGVLYGIAKAWSMQFDFASVLTVTSYALLVAFTCKLIGILLASLLKCGNGNIATWLNADWLLSKDAPGWAHNIAGSFNIPAIWSLTLLATGFYRQASGKLPRLAAPVLPVLPWLAFLVIRAKFPIQLSF